MNRGRGINEGEEEGKGYKRGREEEGKGYRGGKKEEEIKIETKRESKRQEVLTIENERTREIDRLSKQKKERKKKSV